MFIETNWTKKGRGPGGIIGMTENPQTMAGWVYSMDATMTLTCDLKKMSGDDANVQTTYKKEAESRINRDGHDRQSLLAALESRIDSMDPVTHAAGCLINISIGQIAQPNFNVDRALEIGREQLKQFEASWPDGFYNTLSKQVVTFAERKKRLSVGESAIVDQEAIYARVTTVSQRLITSPLLLLWMCQRFFGLLTGHLAELLAHSYPSSRHGSVCGCLKLMFIYDLTDIVTTLLKVPLDHLEPLLLVSTSWTLKHHFQIKTQSSGTRPTRHS